jgi:hypothetical protein
MTHNQNTYTIGTRVTINGTAYIGTVTEVRNQGVLLRVELDERTGSTFFGASELTVMSTIHPVFLATECATCGEAIVSRVEKQSGLGTYTCTEGHVHNVGTTDTYPSMDSPVSPRMAAMLTWLVHEDKPTNVANVRTVEALIRRGLVAYVPNPVYGRPVVVTAAGRAAVIR